MINKCIICGNEANYLYKSKKYNDIEVLVCDEHKEEGAERLDDLSCYKDIELRQASLDANAKMYSLDDVRAYIDERLGRK